MPPFYDGCMDLLALLLFTLILITTIASGLSVVYALLAGYVIFFSYALIKGHPAGKVLRMSLSGLYEIRNILITFILIGMLTALWRAAGTIPSIVLYSSGAIIPEIFLLTVFLLNSLISFLTGTSFGSAATMGVICMTAGHTIGADPVLTGGAVLSGVFFGDRCSPMSTSALLIADITRTDIFRNISLMMKSAAVPFAVTCMIYLVMSLMSPSASHESSDLVSLFRSEFRIGLIPLIPAFIMLILSFFRVRTKMTMSISIISALVICIFYERMAPGRILDVLLSGYEASSAELSPVIDGGGIFSMVTVALVVAISSSYAGIFRLTGILNGLKRVINSMLSHVPSSFIITLVAVITSMVSCNQSLATMLTDQLCEEVERNESRRALALENSVIVIAPLIPWSIAGSVPLSTIGASLSSLFAACYLYLIPLWFILSDVIRKHESENSRISSVKSIGSNP